MTGLAPGVTEKQYLVEIKAFDGENYQDSNIIYGKTARFTVQPIRFVDGISVSYPANDKTTLSITDTALPELLLSFTGSPSHKTGSWVSSDPKIATVEKNEAGKYFVTPSGKGIGAVSFTFTADNGGTAGGPSGEGKNTVTTKTYTVTAGKYPALTIPDNANRIITQKDAPVTVLGLVDAMDSSGLMIIWFVVSIRAAPRFFV